MLDLWQVHSRGSGVISTWAWQRPRKKTREAGEQRKGRKRASKAPRAPERSEMAGWVIEAEKSDEKDQKGDWHKRREKSKLASFAGARLGKNLM